MYNFPTAFQAAKTDRCRSWMSASRHSNPEEVKKGWHRVENFTEKSCDLLGKKNAKRLFFLIDAFVDVEIVLGLIETDREGMFS